MATLATPPAAGGALDDEHVFVPLADHVVALSRATGETDWVSPTSIEAVAPPIVSGTSVFVITAQAIHELDQKTGMQLRRLELPARPTAPALLSKDRILVPIEPDLLIAINLKSGAPEWMESPGAAIRVPLTLGVDGTVAYAALSDGRLASIEVTTGRRRWVSDTLAGTLGAIAVSRERVFVGSSANALYARRVNDGRSDWTFPAGGSVLGVAVRGDFVYVVSRDNTVRALSAGSGNQRWLKTLTTRPTAAPRLTGSAILVMGVSPLLTGYELKAGAAAGTFTLQDDLENAIVEGEPLVFDVPVTPGAAPDTSLVLVTRDGRVVGLESAPAAAPAVAPPTSSVR